MARRGNRQRPRALFVAPIMPSDRGNGLAMRAGFFLKAYAEAFDVDLAIVPLSDKRREITPYVAAHARRATTLDLVVSDTQFSLLCRLADREERLEAFRQYGRPSMASGINAALSQAMTDWAGEASYELVHVFRLYLSDLVEPWLRGDNPFLVLDCDEDDVSAYRRLAGLERNWGRDFRARWLEAEAQAFKTMADRSLPRFDLLLAASSGEARLLRGRAGGARVTVVPNTMPWRTARGSARRDPAGRRDIVFVGNMSYLPNIDAVKWFVTRIWPKVRAAAPFPVRFAVVGYDPPPSIEALARRPDIVVTGRVADVARFYRNAAIAVVPIRAGGGTRIKLLESAGFGVPMIATSFGASGTAFRHGVEILLADQEDDFAASCIRLLADRKLALRLALQASRRARLCYDPRGCAHRFLETIETHVNFGVKPTR